MGNKNQLNTLTGKQQRGFTLIELVVALAVLFALTIAFMPKIKQAMSLGDSGVVRAHVTEIQQGALLYRQTVRSYSGISMAELDNMDFITDELGDGSGKNPWGGNYSVAADSSNPTQFIITVSGIQDPGIGAQLRAGFESYAAAAAFSSGTLTITMKG